jgi:hypothetical protein
VSKSQLLDGLEDEEEDDDDEIDLADLPFDVPKEGFEALQVFDIGGGAFQTEHEKILRDAFDKDQVFQQELGLDAIKVEPFKLTINDEQWGKEARNRAPPRTQSQERQQFVIDTVQMMEERGIIERCQVKAYSQIHITPKKNGRIPILYRL